MIYWDKYIKHDGDIQGIRKKFDNTIYTFDIETTSLIKYRGEYLSSIKYKDLSEDEKEDCNFYAFMYIWMFSINDTVYYGRTWDELRKFIKKVNDSVPIRKILYIHNASFEFQFLKSEFTFTNMTARKAHKVMSVLFEEFDFEIRCTYMMSNCALKQLPKIFNLDVEKMTGDLDYTLIRNSKTILSEKELKYCENDCLVIYKYILRELETYKTINKIPLTSTGHVRNELKELVMTDFQYKRIVRKAINTDPHIYNLLLDAFAGGYTHANVYMTDTIIENVDSWDFTSSYPYILVTHRFPSTEFKKVNILDINDLSNQFAYLIKIRLNGIKSKYYNNFISKSKCNEIVGGRYDNGRIIKADTLITTCTDVDIKLYFQSYNIESYEIIEIYQSKYNYLPKQFIEFVLAKYVNKTKFKNVEGMEIEYAKEKNKFNSLYGMSVTNMIKDAVTYDNETGWMETPIDNEEIKRLLENEKKKAFMSFAWGVWVTSFARSNLLKNVMLLDDYAVYMDTDSIKCKAGYDKSVIEKYNEFVKEKIKHVSSILEIPFEKFAPKDNQGVERMLGLFDDDGHYLQFKTQGAKKYAYIKEIKNSKIKDNMNVIERGDEKSKVLEITVAGVPKQGASQLKSLDDFKDDLVFDFEHTGKNLLFYVEEQEDFTIEDYQGNIDDISQKSGCCICPTTYVLGKALEYVELIDDLSSARARFKE